MTKNIISTAAFIMLMSSAIFAQEAQTTPGSTGTVAAPSPKSSKMAEYCAKMKQAPKKGFKHSMEWGGIYGGPRNQVSYRMFGHNFNQDLRERNAVRMSAGYLFNPYLYVGGGMGAEFQRQGYTNRVTPAITSPDLLYSTVSYTGSMVMIPIYMEVKGYFINKPIAPFVQYRMGYAPVIYNGEGQHTVEHSSYNNLSIGVRIYSCLSITAGYLFTYQPTSISGYDQRFNNAAISDRSGPFQNRFTVGIAMGM